MRKFIFVMIILLTPLKTHAYLSDNIQQFDDHCYKIFDYGMAWDDAKNFCENIGGHLATITSHREQIFINKMILNYGAKNYYWLGASKDNFENWHWLTGEYFYYTNWNVGEPNNEGGDEKYLMIYKSNLMWNDVNYKAEYYGNYNFGFICEWESSGAIKFK